MQPSPFNLNQKNNNGFPYRTSAIIAVIAIWNLILLPTTIAFFKNPNHPPTRLEYVSKIISLSFILILSVSALIVEPVQKLILKPGRTIDEVKKHFYFFIFLSVVMLLMSIFLPH